MNASAKYNFAIVGATGLVGRTFLKVLEERKLPMDNIYMFASSRSAGKSLDFMGKTYEVIELIRENIQDKNIDIALFSAGGAVSKEFAPMFAEIGAVVIDNSSCYRMESDIPLIVPEVNSREICNYKNRNIIANPNCSTIQAMPIIKPIMDKYGVKRIVYSTYQAVSGAGALAVEELSAGENVTPRKFRHQIAYNCIPEIDIYLENGYYKEEQKMIDETRKILSAPELRVTATTVRVPVYFGHSESINIELEHDFEDISEIRELLSNADGVVVMDDPANGVYPTPLFAAGKDEVFVGRIRRDYSVESGINLFCAADNIRKGAATNAVQIAQSLIEFWRQNGK